MVASCKVASCKVTSCKVASCMVVSCKVASCTGKAIFNPTSMDLVYSIMMLSWCICDSWAMAFVFWTRCDSIQPGKAKISISRLRICIPRFRVYRIYWLNILSTDAYGDLELGKEILNFVCLTRHTCCAFHNDVKFVYLSFVSYNVHLFYSLWLGPAGQS
jgi:hypothetical protein